MTIPSPDFVREQYITLREEIKDTKDRIFKISAIGLFTLPAGQYLANVTEAKVLLLFLPFIVISVAFLYLSENHSLMRCGRYIRLHIEKTIPDITGWESWLESDDHCDPRNVDKYVDYSIYIVLGVYYLVAILLCFEYASTSYGLVFSASLVGIYAGLGVVFINYLRNRLRSTTTTKTDTHLLQQLSQSASIRSK
jgi:hypothetical protein